MRGIVQFISKIAEKPVFITAVIVLNSIPNIKEEMVMTFPVMHNGYRVLNLSGEKKINKKAKGRRIFPLRNAVSKGVDSGIDIRNIETQ